MPNHLHVLIDFEAYPKPCLYSQPLPGQDTAAIHKRIIYLSYIHNNPCSGVWNLAGSPVDYNTRQKRICQSLEWIADGKDRFWQSHTLEKILTPRSGGLKNLQNRQRKGRFINLFSEMFFTRLPNREAFSEKVCS